MIFDNKANLDFYKTLGVGDRYKKAIEWLQNNDLENMENGKYEIDGKMVFANVMSYETIAWEDAKFEAHENYTDIQYIISGKETLSYAPVDALTEKVPYNPDKDVVFFDNSNPGHQAVVGAGEYMIFFPWDGHKPKAAAGEPCEVKKVVVKICEK